MTEGSTAPLIISEPVREYLPPSAEEKAQWVRRFLASGLSIRKFSDQHKIARMSLWRWVHTGTESSAGDTGDGAVTTQFAEIKLASPLAGSGWAVELTLPNGTILRLSKDVPSAVVDQLLRIC